ncbi:hypothetical protein HY993_04710 [Candidatus Micrarchaeota archaeon]|nr:hypothetical protein [Candidatus Micrarchaeota archaeon]
MVSGKQFGSSEKKIGFNLFIGVAALAAVLLVALVFVYLDSSGKTGAGAGAASGALVDSSNSQAGSAASAAELASLKAQVQSLTGEKASLGDQLAAARKQVTDLQVKTAGVADSMALFTASQKNGVSASVFTGGKATLDSLLANPDFASRKEPLSAASGSFNSTSNLLLNYSSSADYLQAQFALWHKQGCDYWIGGGSTNATIRDGFCVEALRNVFSTKRAWVFVNSTQSYLDSVGESNALLAEAMSG